MIPTVGRIVHYTNLGDKDGKYPSEAQAAIEMVDGREIWSWCIVSLERWNIPETDHVLILKSLIEGEEYCFREIGIRGPILRNYEHKDPYRRGFLPVEYEAHGDGMKTVDKFKATFEGTRMRCWLNYHACIENYRRRFEPPAQKADYQEMIPRML